LGTPRLLLDGTGKLIGVMALDIAAGQVQAVSAIVNPDRLRHIDPIDDLWDSWRGRTSMNTLGAGFARGEVVSEVGGDLAKAHSFFEQVSRVAVTQGLELRLGP
jgi:hypothetical protein